MSTTNESTGTLMAKAGLGSVQGSIWENERDGKSYGLSATLTKSYYDRSAEQMKKSSVSLTLPELSAALSVLSDLQHQVLLRSREIKQQSA